MTSIQNNFIEFHKRIKSDADILREKRDIILEKICRKLKLKNLPLPEPFNQGSYIYGVGIKPLSNQDYDIDVGLIFDINLRNYEAKTVRTWVLESIEDHTKRGIEEHGNCIRVLYKNDPSFHVDLVCYARFTDSNGRQFFQLAHKNNEWKNVNPVDLKKFINKAREPFKETNNDGTGDQLQRVTRYLKRWNDLQIPGQSPDKPSGLAILLLAIQQLNNNGFVDTNKNYSNDLEALITITRISKTLSSRIIIYKPTPEYEDVFAKLDFDAMHLFKSKLANLHDVLIKVRNEPDLNIASLKLQEIFGDDFSKFSKINNFTVSLTEKNIKQQYPHCQTLPWPIKDIAKVTIDGYVYLNPQNKKLSGINSDGRALPPGLKLKYIASTSIQGDFQYYWQVVNTGEAAKLANNLRGGFEQSVGSVKWENTKYKGKHWVECFIVKNNECIARSGKFFINIT